MSADDKETFPSAWTRPRRQRERPALSRKQIVAEAVRLLDAEGVNALSMRRLGARLGAGATSMYSHVTSKDELIELAVDEVYAEIQVPDADDPAGWRASLSASAHSLRSMILRHPWMASLLGQVGLAYLGPNVMRLNERMLALCEAAGFSLEEANQAMSAVAAYVIGSGTSEAAWLTLLARSGQNERDLTERLRPAVEQAAQPYPRLRRHFAAYVRQDPQRSRDDDFTYGLDRILDGLEARLGHR